MSFWTPNASGSAVLKVVPLRGGVSRTLTEGQGTGGSWSPDGRWIYFTRVDGGQPSSAVVQRVPATSGPVESVVAPDPDGSREQYVLPTALPDGTHLLVTVIGEAGGSVGIVDLETRSVLPLLPGVGPIYSPTGHILFTSACDSPVLMAVPFDLGRREVTGAPVPVLEDLMPPLGHVAVSAGGRLVYRRAETRDATLDQWTPVWVDRQGAMQVVDSAWQFNPGFNNRGITISPDGERVAVNLLDASNGAEDIYVKQLPRGPFSRLTTDPVEDVRPKWTRDGRSIYYISRRAEDGDYDIWIRRADGIGEPTLLLDHDRPIFEAEIAPDGETVLIRVGGQRAVAGERDILIREPGDSVALPALDAGYDEMAIALSPDGRWLAYESDETGRHEIYVRPFPDVRGGKFPVSLSGGTMPVWANTTNELFFVDGSREFVAARYDATDGFRVTGLDVLFTLPPDLLFSETEFYALYDASPDDQRFLWLESTGERAQRELILVDNWAEELERESGR